MVARRHSRSSRAGVGFFERLQQEPGDRVGRAHFVRMGCDELTEKSVNLLRSHRVIWRWAEQLRFIGALQLGVCAFQSVKHASHDEWKFVKAISSFKYFSTVKVLAEEAQAADKSTNAMRIPWRLF
jgi:hypothetical protein